jgi:hypothetical protein
VVAMNADPLGSLAENTIDDSVAEPALEKKR